MMGFSKYQFKILVDDVTLLKVTLRVTCMCIHTCIHTYIYIYIYYMPYLNVRYTVSPV